MSENNTSSTATTTPAEVGYFTGILDVYFAKMLTEDTSDSAPTYDTPVILGKSIEVVKMVRFEVGEGLQKREENFAEEVAKQMM